MAMKNKSEMIGKRVVFWTNSQVKVEGRIMDKVNVPHTSGTNEYVPMDNYLIADDNGNIYIVNPVMIIRIKTKKTKQK
jgi:hypothetical protein